MGTDRLPPGLWVRYGDQVHQLPLCPDARPYSTVALHRAMAGWEPGAPAEPMVIHSTVDDSTLTVTGSGVSEQDPMFCAELQGQPVPVCRCAEGAGQGDAVDGDPASVPAPPRRRVQTVWLPGDSPI